MSRPFKVLSIDGGGIRGVIPARVLVELERLTGKRIAKLFDLIIGTSTGGILALGLVRPDEGRFDPKYPAQELLALYRERGAWIFPQEVRLDETGRSGLDLSNHPKLRKYWPLIRPLLNQWVMDAPEGPTAPAGARYFPHNLQLEMSERFGRTWLSEAVTRVMVTSFDLESRRAILFDSGVKFRTSLRSEPEPEHGNLLMSDVALATSAAPTYFPPHRPAGLYRRGPDGKPAYEEAAMTLVDGGVFANNPAMLGYLEARKILRAEDEEARPIALLSLGTGELVDIARTRPSHIKDWGLIQMGQAVVPMAMDGTSDAYQRQLQDLSDLEGERLHYLRIQPRLTPPYGGLDDVAEHSVDTLIDLAQREVESKRTDVQDMIEVLQAAG